ncbi:response regulator [Asticcacaulis sp. YBE204]|uniref:response regulator n=1 Tax=Asticcacaulis sp. YBE204 TaxID=1282363 RepID=UPI0003C3CBB2|nr:response regulator [Asticcacaulis sp. YBE204]ESQ79416.1 hypothetical protein AEYBE204_10440 [Asticcacaulis sp. YBE204]
MTMVEETTAPIAGAVLVVDDEPGLRFPISEVLRDAGVVVLEAGNADEALELLQSDRSIRVVFSDVRMPGTMDGVGLATAIESAQLNITVILASGNPPVLTDPFRPIITKPYSLDLVSAQILRALNSPDDGKNSAPYTPSF